MQLGFVKWYNVNKQYGFIHPDIFIGPEAIQPIDGMISRVSPANPRGWLQTGDQVEYEAVMTRKGLKAVIVRLA